MENNSKTTKSLCSFFCNNNPAESPRDEEDGLTFSNARTMGRKPGWKAIPYILGIAALETLAMFGTSLSFMVYLLKVYHFSQVDAANVISIWYGVSNCIPIIGAFVADACLGKFRTIHIALFGSLLGTLMLGLTSWVPQFHPPNCPSQQKVCASSTPTQFSIFVFALCLLALGAGGIRPCTMPFAIDQFDRNTPEGRKGVTRFFNWYYTTYTLANIVSSTLIVYVLNKNWVIGFGTVCVIMFCATIIFLCGTRVYYFMPPEGSIFSGIAQVFVAAYKKHHLQDPENDEKEQGVYYYDPPLKDDKAMKMNLSKQIKCLNKAALIQDSELNEEGCPKNPWRLCSIQQVEEIKCLIKIIPIWASGILCMIPVIQQGTFPVSQALMMDRKIGQNFEIPASSFNVVSLITVGIWLPLYDLFLQQPLAKLTKREEGLTCLQKIVIGNIFSVFTMVCAGIVEWKRRSVANSLDGVAKPMSAIMWLSPQYVLLGFSEVFLFVGHIQFYNSEAPEKMRSVCNSLHFLVLACSSYAGTLVINIVHSVTQKNGGIDWLNNDLNDGRLDYYYFLIAGLAGINLVYVLFCVKQYRYKAIVKSEGMDSP